MQVACVLKSGGEYRAEHVSALADSILKHNNLPIVCLTDAVIDDPKVKVIPLKHSWPGWWSKIELFRVCQQPTLYLDLDTVVVGELPEIGPDFTMLADVYWQNDVGSGVMSWRKCPTYIYETFCQNPAGYMRLYRTRQRWGDQGFIRDHYPGRPQTFGPEYRSYKVFCRRGVPAGTKVVYFHGRPKPWQVELQYA